MQRTSAGQELEIRERACLHHPKKWEEHKEGVVVMGSGYEIRKDNHGVKRDSNTDKRSIRVFPTAVNDVRSPRVSDK